MASPVRVTEDVPSARAWRHAARRSLVIEGDTVIVDEAVELDVGVDEIAARHRHRR